MSPGVHIINKQVFEFECEQSEHAFKIREKTGQAMQDRIAKAIDRVCNRLAFENADFQIPFLEINLGKISFERLEEEIVDVFEKAFYEKLTEWKNNNSKTGSASVSEKLSSFEIAKTFFLTGSLPWFAGKPGKKYAPDLVTGLFSVPPDELKNFILLNLSNQKFIERLSSHLDAAHLNYTINLLGINTDLIFEIENEIKKSFEEIILLIKNALGKTGPVTGILPLQKKDMDDFKASEKTVTRFLDIIKREDSIHLHKIAFEFVFKLISEKNKFSADDLFYQLKKMLCEKFELSLEILKRPSVKEIQYPFHLQELVKQESKKLEDLKTDLIQQAKEDDKNSGVLKFYISNSGLVIIANYFPVFFNELQLLENGNFKSKQDQIKAVFLLHYLCTGEETSPEYTLQFNKILCGLALDEPLPSLVPFNEKEKNECNELLNEVIYNWQKLGHTSAEALREAFLSRDGILSWENNGWKLQVERKGYDILLDSLPWSFNHVKLSWMENVITTEW